MSNSTQPDPPVIHRAHSIPRALSVNVIDPPIVPAVTMQRELQAPEIVDGAEKSQIAEIRTESVSEGLLPAAAENVRAESLESNPAATRLQLSDSPVASTVATTKRLRWYQWPLWLLGRAWDLTCLCVLIAIVAAIPLVQLASLGYLLNAAGNLANRKPWRTALPGLRSAGKLGTFALFVAISWLPIYVLTDLAYSAQLLQPNSAAARGWRVGAFLSAVVWVVYVGWAAMRGGRWWNFLWPAPLKFVTSFWRPVTWSRASDQLYNFVLSLQFPKLWWLGARASIGALLWTCVPVSLMIIGERAHELKPAALVGIVGALGMTVVMLYLPMLQVHMAAKDRFLEIFNVRAVRRSFMHAPWFYAVSIFVLCALAIPLYLLRIEATPSQLVWAPSLVFVVLMFPAKLLMGTALGYAHGRQRRRHWLVRWPAWGFELASVLIYVGALYVAQFIAWQGAYVMYFQHAVLVPAPLIST